MSKISIDKIFCKDCKHKRYNFLLPIELPENLKFSCSKCSSKDIVFEVASSHSYVDTFSGLENPDQKNFNGFRGINGIKSSKLIEIWKNYKETGLPYKLQASGYELGYQSESGSIDDSHDDIRSTGNFDDYSPLEWSDEDEEWTSF